MKKYYVISIIALIAGFIYFNKNSEKSSDILNEINNMTNQNEENIEVDQNLEGEPANQNINQESGLKIEVISEGSGLQAGNGDVVSVHYTGKLEDGTVFDSSIPRGEPIQFILGIGQVIPGWEQGILNMKIGEKRNLIIPSDLAYGDNGIVTPAGQVVIPPKATLYFAVELMAVEKSTETNEVSN